jgi:putative drug exporter of the RND superfamily
MSNSKVSQPMGTGDLAAPGPIYQPPKVLTQDDFKKAAGMFISPDGHAARYLVQTRLNPFSVVEMNQVNSITDAARKAQPNTALADAKISTAGISSGLRDTRDYYNQDLRFIVVTTIIIVLLILTAFRNQRPRARQDAPRGPVIRRRSSQ